MSLVKPPSYSAGTHIKPLDGIRGIALLLVLANHTSLPTGPLLYNIGAFAMSIFFSLSGFLMAYLYIGFINNRSSVLVFWTHRFFRIAPAFMLITFLLWLSQQMSVAWPYGFTTETLLYHWLYLKGDGVFWSIVVEMKFYLLFPLFALGITKFKIPQAKVLLLFFGLWCFLVLVDPFVGRGHQSYKMLPYLAYFISGIFFGYLETTNFSEKKWVKNLGRLCAFLCPLIILVVISSYTITSYFGWHHYAMTSFVSGIIVWGATRCTGLIFRLLTNRFITFIGIISYSIYLSHRFIMYIASHIFYTNYVTANILLGWLCCFTIASIVYIFVE